MVRFLSFLFLYTAIFTATFFTARYLHLLAPKIPPASLPASYTLQNLPLCIIVVNHNNGAFAQKTLQSLFSQNYDNCRLIYVDDASNDGSFELSRDLIFENARMKFDIVQNEKRIGPVASLMKAVKACDDEEITSSMPQPVSAIDSRITGLSAMQLGAARPVEIVHTPTLILPTPKPGSP